MFNCGCGEFLQPFKTQGMLIATRFYHQFIKKSGKPFYIPSYNIFCLMLVVKVSDKIKYNVGKLQRGIEVSDNIPKVVITIDKEDD